MKEKKELIFPLTKSIMEWYRCPDLDNENISKQEYTYIGKENIRRKIRPLRTVSKKLGEAISLISRQIEFIKNNNAESIMKIAKQYENPTFPKIELVTDPLSNTTNLKPTDQNSIDRKECTTTFNICGWCKYFHTGQEGYNQRYFHHGKCEFEWNGGTTNKKNIFNTPCFLQTASKEAFKTILNNLEEARKELIQHKKTSDSKISFLLKIEKDADFKPVFCVGRPYDYTKVGDKVVVYDKSLFLNKYIFVSGTIVRRTYKGYLLIYLDKAIKKEHLFKKIYRYQIGNYDPHFFLAEDFETLIEDINYAEMWVKQATSRQYCHKRLLQDMIKFNKYYKKNKFLL